MREAIYIGNTQKTFKKIMDVYLYGILRILKNGQKYIELTFSICRIDLLNLAGIHLDMYRYMVVNFSMSNV